MDDKDFAIKDCNREIKLLKLEANYNFVRIALSACNIVIAR